MDAPEQTQGPTLGVAAIAYNEEEDLQGFLDNLLPWVDEIVIVDDGSTDRTAEVARAAGPKVKFITAAHGATDYSQQRNKGIDAATSDWLLHMDIDERVTPELAHEIRCAIRTPAHDGYRFRRLNFFLHRPMHGGGWQNWNQVHLARRDKLRFARKLHEIPVLDAPPDRVGQLKAMMWHLNDDSYVERMRKSFAYCQGEAENILATKRPIRWHTFLWRPLQFFLKRYLLQQGFRDGMSGLIAAVSGADATMRSYAIAWDVQNRVSRQALENELLNLWKREREPSGTDVVLTPPAEASRELTSNRNYAVSGDA